MVSAIVSGNDAIQYNGKKERACEFHHFILGEG
jgi:hypothetical protein